MSPAPIPCTTARERLSVRLDGEPLATPGDARALAAHLAGCEECREHERALLRLKEAFEELRSSAPPVADLWPELERRARRTPAPVLVRLAAALVGFLSVAAAARVLARPVAPSGTNGPEHHLLERLLPAAHADPFTALPEYRLLRTLPSTSPEVPR